MTAFFSALQLFASAGALAQSTKALPPIPGDVRTVTAPHMESCNTINCDVSAEQIRAFDAARGLYMKSSLAAATFSVVFGHERENIAITFIPSPLGTRGRAITYLFDSSGVKVERSYINR
jgi:hypothetical protein